MKSNSTIVSMVLLFVLIAVAGCGTDYGPIGAISGTLKMDGKALPAGTKVIFMHPTAGHAGFGLTDAAGAYRIEWRRDTSVYDGVPIGKYQVMLVPADTMDVDSLTADELLDGAAAAKVPKSVIPAKYQRASTSGLEYEIVEGENLINLEVSSK